MSPRPLEAVLRFAYVNGYTCEKWAEPTRQCLKKGDRKTTIELCELLLNRFFAQTRVSEPLLERYVAYAITGNEDLAQQQQQQQQFEAGECLIPPPIFLTCLVKCIETTAIQNPRQWAHILKCLPTVLSVVNADQIVSDLLNEKPNNEWPRILCNVFIMLSRLVAVGLYRDYYAKDNGAPLSSTMMAMEHEMATATQQQAASQLNNTQPGGSSLPFNFTMSQPSAFDPDATIDLAAFAEEPVSTEAIGSIDGHYSAHDSTQSTMMDSERIESSNAIRAAQIIVDLIENRSAKRIFEMMNNQQQRTEKKEARHAEEPWATCQAILAVPSSQASVSSADMSQNTHIQKLLLMINRLTDRDLDRRMAVHLKYQELEDEGTARALPSAGLMGYLYHMVQIRPGLSDDYIIDCLSKLQIIKGAFDESFFLEIWFAALTGLREASIGLYKPESLSKKENQQEQTISNSGKLDVITATNSLLWRNLVLVKVPYLIKKLQERKGSDDAKAYVKRPDGLAEGQEYNSLESSLAELHSFAGLLNGCSSPMATFEFFASSTSSKLFDKMTSGTNEEEEDDFMKLINDMGSTVDLNTAAVAKAIKNVGNEEIFTSIVRVCQDYGFVRDNVAQTLLKNATPSTKQEDNDQGFDIDMLDLDGGDAKQHHKNEDVEILTKNVEDRMNAIKENISRSAITELLHIAIVSMIHTRRIIDFVIELLVEKAEMRDIYSLARICDALNKCPPIIDVIGQLYHPVTILGPLEQMCNHWKPADSEMELDGRSGFDSPSDEDTDGVQVLYGKYGKIWTLIILVLNKFNLYVNIDSVFSEVDGFCYQFFTQGPLIYGRDVEDLAMDQFIRQWQTALLGDGISDDLLRFSTPQQLLQAAPTLLQRSILVYENGQIDNDTLLGIISYFQEKFLNFTLFPGIVSMLCDDVLAHNVSIAIMCLHQLLMSGNPPDMLLQLCGSSILGALLSLAEQRKQERIVAGLPAHHESSNSNNDSNNESGWEAQLNILQNHIKTNLGIEETNEQRQHHTETISTRVTCDNLSRKAQEMFRYIVKSGRSMFMRDVDADVVALWDASKAPKQVITHYLDMVMFQTVLDIGGPHWFVDMIVNEVLEAGKSGGAVRAAELGSCLITTPLARSADLDSSCSNLLRCLLQDIIPASLKKHASANASFFQGQTLGVFTSDCLVLMHDRGHDQEREFVHEFGHQFFETLVVDSENAPQMIHVKHDSTVTNGLVGALGRWPDMVIESPVWRGFLKGLMSNPLINESWPNTFI
ncbi:mediator complex subunit Med5-domain-containing protein [Zychaea mexicana]|uniref:mediator complex subunit Med5-domain-containing protein n=1 Tax=Zychaea mexicana TaxID=64656 RepID=UPI0022FF087A|nr:mediator complex subunit Med5-domain-containing protein [Zychaea mexicana]KAI9493318.1 mediator complex subunit Med5-domain-containing protein [Zychaea mexicana]